MNSNHFIRKKLCCNYMIQTVFKNEYKLHQRLGQSCSPFACTEHGKRALSPGMSILGPFFVLRTCTDLMNITLSLSPTGLMPKKCWTQLPVEWKHKVPHSYYWKGTRWWVTGNRASVTTAPATLWTSHHRSSEPVCKSGPGLQYLNASVQKTLNYKKLFCPVL